MMQLNTQNKIQYSMPAVKHQGHAANTPITTSLLLSTAYLRDTNILIKRSVVPQLALFETHIKTL